MRSKKTSRNSAIRHSTERRVRYAIVGLGYIAQGAVLPDFRHTKNAKLVASISSDKEKLRELSKQHKVKYTSDCAHFEGPNQIDWLKLRCLFCPASLLLLSRNLLSYRRC